MATGASGCAEPTDRAKTEAARVPTASLTASPTSTDSAELTDQIRVSQPRPGDPIASPLVVAGEARGSWYFEAVFGVRLEADDGTVLAADQARAQADWMTADFVPFEATLVFSTAPAAARLVLEKANPSGRRETAAALTIPLGLRP